MDFFVEDIDQTATLERDIVPAGVHVMTITNAEEGPNQYKVSDENPDGMCLKLRLSTGAYKFVFDDIPKHLGWRAKQLASALGIVPVGGRLSLDPMDLHNQAVTVEISHYTSKAGKLSAVVKRYVPATETQATPVARAAAPAPAQPAVKRRTAVVRQESNLDDIPF